MKIVIISDTHARHEFFDTLSGDVLIHCGDMLELFDPDAASVTGLDDWFSRQDFSLILCTGGNHDRELETVASFNPQPFENAVFLQDNG